MKVFITGFTFCALIVSLQALASPYQIQGPFVHFMDHDENQPVYPAPGNTPGKFFSSFPDRNAAGDNDPGQTMAFDGAGGTLDGSLDNIPGAHANGEIDGIAERGDRLFDALLANRAELLVSFENNPDIYLEDTTGATALWADGPTNIDDNNGFADLDGLDIWQVEPHEAQGILVPAPQSAYYSLEGTAVAINKVSPGPQPNQPLTSVYVTTQILTEAVANQLFGIPSMGADLDVDAFIVCDRNNIENNEVIKRVIFSVAPVTVGWPGSEIVLDGGEIFVWDEMLPATSFLVHGGHVWNTDFDVAGAFSVTSENVNALEALGGGPLGLFVFDPIPPYIDPSNQFIFDLVGGEGLWFDPVVAEGFSYETDGFSNFVKVEPPPLTAVPDADGKYLVTDNLGGSVYVPAGTVHTFPTPVYSFTITGINPVVDGTDPLAFPTLLTFDQPVVNFTMVAILGSALVPALGPLGLSGLGILIGALGVSYLFVWRRRRTPRS